MAENAQKEKQILDATRDAIARHRMGPATIRVVDAEGNPVAGASVEVEQRSADFLFGCNIYMFDRFDTDEKNAAYKRRYADIFNYATTGFYWHAYERERGKPDYPYTDKVVAWSREHGVRLKGHPLLWAMEYGIPPWSDGQPAPEIQKARVEQIMRRYEGAIEFWEVVNEPAHLPGLGIDDPYRWARDASPDAYLIVNDYYVMADGYQPFHALLSRAIDAGVPFDGIGIQAHEPEDMAFPLERVQRILDDYASLGRELHITEFTPCSNDKPVLDSPWRGMWTEEQQADYAEDFYRVCFAHPSVVAVTWWDFCDVGSWRPDGGMLRADMTPKPVYERLRRLIRDEWRTRAEVVTDDDGQAAFTGFHGDYRIAVKAGDAAAETTFRLRKGATNTQTVSLGSE